MKVKVAFVMFAIISLFGFFSAMKYFNHRSDADYVELQEYDTKLPKNVSRDLSKLINFALQDGSLDKIDDYTIGSCIILVTNDFYYNSKYNLHRYVGKLSAYIDGVIQNYDGIVCYVNSEGWSGVNKSLLIWKDGEPQYAYPDPNRPSLALLGEFSTYPSSVVAPVDLDRVGLVSFKLRESLVGDFILADGRTINAVVHVPGVYLHEFDLNRVIEDIPRK